LFLAHTEEVAEEVRKLQIRQWYLSGKVAYWEVVLQKILSRENEAGNDGTRTIAVEKVRMFCIFY
jgi:hypothetical protein